VLTSLLTTKLFFPPARPALVPRPRLVDRLQTGLHGPLTLISAPVSLECVLADADSDSECNHQHVRRLLKARSSIPAKRGKLT
jgi:LuxR family transcriptional regulator, maltose regulon positive regulatory protein